MQNNVLKTKQGSIGLTVRAQPQISFSVDAETPVIGSEGKINLKIINKGFADARFVSIKIIPSGYTVLSEEEIYIGTVDSDDFETAVFDVIFKKQNPDFNAIFEYTDFDNQKKTQQISLPIKVYTKEKALELGIIKKSNTFFYMVLTAGIIILWIIFRSIRKRKRMKRSLEER
jgi:hypothetical protein